MTADLKTAMRNPDRCDRFEGSAFFEEALTSATTYLKPGGTFVRVGEECVEAMEVLPRVVKPSPKAVCPEIQIPAHEKAILVFRHPVHSKQNLEFELVRYVQLDGNQLLGHSGLIDKLLQVLPLFAFEFTPVLASRFSIEPNCCINFTAVLGPIPGTPGMLFRCCHP